MHILQSHLFFLQSNTLSVMALIFNHTNMHVLSNLQGSALGGHHTEGHHWAVAGLAGRRLEASVAGRADRKPGFYTNNKKSFVSPDTM